MELWFHFFLFPRITERTLKVKRVLKVEKQLLIQKHRLEFAVFCFLVTSSLKLCFYLADFFPLSYLETK